MIFFYILWCLCNVRIEIAFELVKASVRKFQLTFDNINLASIYLQINQKERFD